MTKTTALTGLSTGDGCTTPRTELGAGLKADETLGGRGVEEALCRELGRELDADTKADAKAETRWPLPLPPPEDGGGLPQLALVKELEPSP